MQPEINLYWDIPKYTLHYLHFSKFYLTAATEEDTVARTKTAPIAVPPIDLCALYYCTSCDAIHQSSCVKNPLWLIICTILLPNVRKLYSII